MRFYDLILLRVLLTGCLAGLFLTGFLLLRRLPAAWLSGRLRRGIWLAILILSCCFWPLPGQLRIPADWPEWIYAWRLPDPSRAVLTQTLIDEAAQSWASNRRQPLQPTGGNQTSANPAWTSIPQATSVSEASPAQNQPAFRLPALTMKDKLLIFLAYWRWIWLAGFTVFLMVRLLGYFWPSIRRLVIGTSARPDKTAQPAKSADRTSNDAVPLPAEDGSPPDQAAWQMAIAPVRDQTGYYRYANVISSGPHDEHPLTIWGHWHRHQIPVPTALPSDLPAQQRLIFLQKALDRNNHPDLLIRFLVLFVRSVFWFNPLWLPAHQRLQADLAQAGAERLNQRLGHGNRPRQSWLPATVVSLLLIVCAGLLIWQLPALLLPDIDKAAANQITAAGPLSFHTIQDLPANLAFANGRRLAGLDELAVWQDNDRNGEFFLTRPGSDGLVWQTAIQRLIVQLNVTNRRGASLNYVSLVASRHLPDGRWCLILSCLFDNSDTAGVYYFQLSDDGQQCLAALNLARFNDTVSTAELSYVLMPDGGWISWGSQNSDRLILAGLTQTITASEKTSPLVTLERRSADGRLVWRQTSQDPLLSQFQLGIVQKGYAIQTCTIEQVLPTADSGCYLIISDYAVVYQNMTADWSILAYSGSASSGSINNPKITSFLQPVRIARLDPAGNLLWTSNLPAGETMLVSLQAAVGRDDMLYILGTQTWQTPDQVLPSYAESDDRSRQKAGIWQSLSQYRDAYAQTSLLTVRPDGQLGWQQTFFNTAGSHGLDLLVEPKLITILSYSGAGQSVFSDQSRLTIWQLEPGGRRIAQGVNPNNRNNYFQIQPGQINVPVKSEE